MWDPPGPAPSIIGNLRNRVKNFSTMQFLFMLICMVTSFSASATNYVRSQSCQQCHRSEYKQWQHSHHDQAMQLATPKTVLGNFNINTFEYFGRKTTFLKKGNNYFIKTTGPDGKLKEFVVKYTFGVNPLQQYLIELPGGRLQAFTVAWDVKNKKWFHLYPDENITHDDPLHWSQHHFNWNTSCAECHSTNFQKNYDAKTKSYHSTYSEINVGCQSCHGPGKKHIDWAKQKASGKTVGESNGVMTNNFKNKLEVCARCHSRRHHVSKDDKWGESFYDHFFPALLRQNIYYADGQINEEVYVYGSFLQSKMYRAGVTCMDCHNPHSLQLVAPGNAVCAQCHQKNPVKRFKNLKNKVYDSPAHHHHQQGSTGAQCVSCHMPVKTYMQNDPRHDHGFRIPRPDLTVKIGVPNACNQCHQNKSADWSVKQITKWFGVKHYPEHYGEIFAAAWSNKKNVEAELIKLVEDKQQANIVRATAVDLLVRYPTENSLTARLKALRDDNVLVRSTAITSLSHMPIQERIVVLSPHLKDTLRAIRIEAASALAAAPIEQIPDEYKKAYESAIKEYTALQQANSDQPSSFFNLGNFFQQRKEFDKAVSAYQNAIELDKRFYPAQTNLAALYMTLGKDDKAELVLRDGIKHNKDHGELYYSLGLFYAEKNDMKQSTEMLAKAALLMPYNVRVQYNYGLALQKIGDYVMAEDVLTKALALNDQNPDLLYAIANLYVQQKKWTDALKYANRLHAIIPESNRIKQMIRFIRSHLKID